MLASVRTFTLDGLVARPVRVEVDVHRGLPGFAVVGLPEPAVRETRERVRAALLNSGFEFPLQRIVVNLAPASLRKAGPGMDLAIAVALLRASGQLAWHQHPDLALVGELALDGTVSVVNGALAMAEAARDSGEKAIVMPAANGPEAALAKGIDVAAVDHLQGAVDFLADHWTPPPVQMLQQRQPSPHAPDLADLRGQPELRRALEVAAAGAHGLLMVGPAGSGKSLAAARLPSILPPLAESEALEVVRVASACGRLNAGMPLARPFRAPHHTIGPVGLIGGGRPLRPGEVTLTHRGILYLDEIDQFRRDALEELRVPLADGQVEIACGSNCVILPSRFMLIAAAAPCPCGRGEEDPDCQCRPLDRARHHLLRNGMLGDLFDLNVRVRRPTAEDLGEPPEESSAEVQLRVVAARERQRERLGSARSNAAMTDAEARTCQISSEARHLLGAACPRASQPHAHHRALRLAQTCADLAGSTEIGVDAVLEVLELGRLVQG